jgi:hypothetical protein
MTFSGDIWVLTKLANLAQRCGVSPTVMCFDLGLLDDHDHKGLYYLTYVDGNARNAQEQAGIDKALELLGFNKSGEELTFPDLMSVEAAVDRALSIAPRAIRR